MLNRTRIFSALLIVLALLGACTPHAATPTPEPRGGGGEFRVVLPADPKSLNPNLRAGPYLDQVTYRLVPNPSATSVDLLLKGEIEYTLARPPFARLAELQQAAGVKVQTFAHPARYYGDSTCAAGMRPPWAVRRASSTSNAR